MRSFFWCLTLLTVGLIACQTERPPTAEPIAIVLTATPSPTATGTASHTPSPTTTLTNTPRPTRTPTNTPTVTPTFTPYPTPLPTATPAPTLPASSCQLDLTLVAQTGGEATGLALSEDGRLAYITVGPRLQVYDVADRANPTLQWQSDVFRQRFVDLAVVGEYGFGRLVDGWVVWRMSAVPELLWVSNPEPIFNPYHSGTRRWLTLEDAMYLAISDDEWFIFDMVAPVFPLPIVTQAGGIYELDEGLIVIDGMAEQTILSFAEEQTLPANVVAQLELDGRYSIFATHESYLYLAATEPNKADGFIIDISDLTQPTILANDFPLYFDIVEEGGLWIGLYGERAVYDIAQDPLKPVHLATFDNDPMTYHVPVTWKDQRMLFIHSGRDMGNVWAVLTVLNLSNPHRPNYAITYRLPPLSARQARVFDDTLFVLQDAQLTILDITNLDAIVEIGNIPMVGYGNGYILAGETMVTLGYAYDDLGRVINIRDVLEESLSLFVKRLPINVYGYNLYLHQETIFSAWDGGAFHYNLSTDEFYEWAWEDLPTYGDARFTSYGDYVVVLDNQKLAVLDVSEPIEPLIVGRYTSLRQENTWDSLGHSFHLIHSVAFIASRQALTAVDLTDPTQPQEIGHWLINEFISSLFSTGETLYIVLRDGNTLVFDVSTPTEPRLVQTIGTPISGHLYGDFLIGDDYIYDVADPLNPLLVGETGVSGSIIGIRDNLLYVGSEAGVYVYEIGVRP